MKLYPGINCSPDKDINGTGERFIVIPVYSDEQNEDGSYDVIGLRKEYY